MTSPSVSEQKYEITPLELLFDLVFAFGLAQLSHHLLADLTLRGAAETLVMLLAILTVWSYTSWAATMIRIDRAGARWMVLVVMLLGLFMNAAVTKAFTTSGWAFVIPLLVIQLGRTVWTAINAGDGVHREHYVRVLFWFIATTPLWLVGAFVNPNARVLWWGLAAGIELIGTWLANPIPGRRLRSQNVAFDAEHMLERCRLFILIALGETILTTGAALAEAEITWLTILTGTFALVGTVALWALGFGRSHRLIARHVEQTRDPIRTSRFAVNALMVISAGLIAVAVANEKVIAHPLGHNSLALSLLLVGGPLLFLTAHGWYLWAVPRVRSRLHLLGCIGLLLIGLFIQHTPPCVGLILVGATLAALALFDQRRVETADIKHN